MSAMDHRKSDGVCLYCGKLWPCAIAEARRELAAYLRALPVNPTGDPVWDNGRRWGIDSVADSIDI